MSISSVVDGSFCLDSWEVAECEDVDALSEYSDNLEELEQRAEKVIAAGRFKYLELSRWVGPTDDDWALLKIYTPDESS